MRALIQEKQKPKYYEYDICKGREMMKSHFYSGLLPVCLVACLLTGLNAARAAVQQPQAVEASTDELVIQEAANAFTKAFNAGDANAISALWIEGGGYADEHGQRFIGRAAIKQEYEQFFKQYPGVQIQLKIDSIRLLTPELAIEEGTSSLGAPGTFSPVVNHYLVMHVKQNGKWAIAVARDIRIEAQSTESKVADLDALVGTWYFQRGTTLVETQCRWIADKKFVERRFAVSNDGKITLSGTQIIGWDPGEQKITSRLFDSSGGIDTGIWTPIEKGWQSESYGVTADGSPTSATNMMIFDDADSISWKSVDRTLGGQTLPDAGEIVLKRVPASDGAK
jgi:uncharacterized protein (TIGR02246 family)